MQEILKKITDKKAQEQMERIEGLFKSLPHLPKGIVEFLVKIAPWIVLVAGIGSLYGGIKGIIGYSGVPREYLNLVPHMSRGYLVLSGIIEVINGALLLVAFNPLRTHKFEGWMYLFWVQVLGIVTALLALVFGVIGVFAAVVGTLIGFYLVFEIKPHYKR